ncbi:phytanoyl-CoA dioxygenase family protein [Paenibacillus montanisoli]|uniref:Phytanoyl-CoA dioxygenase family protein n=1 Tax=Paenibacillus montanisoli TaxID=2081970 RepID=A0A328UAS4_9BACL|nr:phytanoyl-CoA dioxygenase family protein [Paenibacillus montanisoli]RAP78421.1 hypothetical protein DL346_08350 [Paenibacillus montanisoli]
MLAGTIDFAKHLEQFKRDGFTILPQLFDRGQIDEWKETYQQVREEVYGDREQGTYVITDMVERRPRTMLAMTAHPDILDFLELVMGPFVQIGDANLNGFHPQPKETSAGRVSGWHRDMYGFAPNGMDYQIPRQALALTYLENMTEETGPLRVIPGSHRNEIYIDPEDQFKPHPDEVLLSLKAGDVIIFSGILHSGTPNTSNVNRILMGGMYTYSWYRPTCNFNGPNIQRLIQKAAELKDRRILRLLGVNGQIEKSRANSGFTLPNEAKWKEWIEEDKAYLNGPLDWWKEPIGG